MALTERQESQIKSLKKELEDKYRKGAEEHGGDLIDKTELELIECAIEETIDQFTYLSSLRDKLKRGQ
jgi:hypothetical protein